MMNTQQRTAVPLWAAGVTVVIALVAIVLYGVHTLRPQAPNSDLKMPSSYHGPQNPSVAPGAAPANQ